MMFYSLKGHPSICRFRISAILCILSKSQSMDPLVFRVKAGILKVYIVEMLFGQVIELFPGTFLFLFLWHFPLLQFLLCFSSFN